jgi:polyhydroxyalkanoate synthesis regulator phasin
MKLEDLRNMFEAAIGTITPASAQKLARDMMDPGAAKEQVAGAAAEILGWSQQNFLRLEGFVQREIQQQMKTMGVATQDDLDAVKKRVRTLEREAGMTASGRKRATTSSRSAGKKPTAARTPAKKRTAPAKTPPEDASTDGGS